MRDYYDVLGVAPDRRRRRNQAGLPAAGAPLSSRHLGGRSRRGVRRSWRALRRPARSGAAVLRRRCRGAARGRADWFADEVAIDFPSVASVLDRMRDAFFGAEPPVTLSAEMVLTPREAFDGVTVLPRRAAAPHLPALRRPRRSLERVVRDLRRARRGLAPRIPSACGAGRRARGRHVPLQRHAARRALPTVVEVRISIR